MSDIVERLRTALYEASEAMLNRHLMNDDERDEITNKTRTIAKIGRADANR